MLWPEGYILFMKHFNKQFGFKCFPILWEAIVKSALVNVLFGIRINVYIFDNVLDEGNIHISRRVLVDIICTEEFFFSVVSHTLSLGNNFVSNQKDQRNFASKAYVLPAWKASAHLPGI